MEKPILLDDGYSVWTPTNSLTRHSSQAPILHDFAANQLDAYISVYVSSIFTNPLKISYYLYVHGPETPSVSDLDFRQREVSAPRTPWLNLRPGGEVSYRVTAQLRSLANVRRRPCRSEPGYSRAQCLKECLWLRLAAHIGCRLPHMVWAEVFLPETRGPLDHLPPCRLLAQMDSPREHHLLSSIPRPPRVSLTAVSQLATVHLQLV